MSSHHSSADFTAAEPTLVAGTLLAYRHFIVADTDHRGPLLWSCNSTPGGHWNFGIPYATTGPHTAECIRIPKAACSPGRTPAADCKCGFYAYYQPGHDFYPGAVGRYVKAAVELSGRVLMGSLGVRAEHMAIKAIAPDYAKIHQPPGLVKHLGGQPKPHRPTAAFGPGAAPDWWNFSGQRVEDDARWYADELLLLKAFTQTVGDRLGVSVHDSVDDLIRAWPRPDLTALGVDPQPPAAVTDSHNVADSDRRPQSA